MQGTTKKGYLVTWPTTGIGKQLTSIGKLNNEKKKHFKKDTLLEKLK